MTRPYLVIAGRRATFRWERIATPANAPRAPRWRLSALADNDDGEHA